MYGKKHLAHNAHTHALARIVNDMQRINEDPNMSELQKLLARQTSDLALALYRTFKESNNGQS